MKPLEKGGGLVDKREQLIFEAYKNRAVPSSRFFRIRIIREYGFEPSSDLYRTLVNYQVKKYGKKLDMAKKPMSKEEAKKRANYMRQIRYKRRQGRKSDEI
jgi:hypothetical protein